MEAQARQPPSPPAWPIVGHLPAFWADPIGTFLNAQRSLGDVVAFQLGPRRLTLISHPDDIKEVLQDRPWEFDKSRGQHSRRLLGKGLLTSPETLWRHQRRLMQPVFARGMLGSFVPKMAACTREMFARWGQQDGVVDLLAEMQQLSLTVVGQVLFGVDLTGQAQSIGRAFGVALEYVSGQVFRFFRLPDVIPTPRNVRYLLAMRELDRFVFGLIELRRREPGDALLSRLLAVRDETTGAPMSDQQVRDEVLTMVLAGQETTAIALAWAFHVLSTRPDIESQVVAEVRSVVRGDEPTADELARMPTTRALFDEVLRLYPPAPIMARYARKDEVLRGMLLPANSLVVMSPYVTQRHAGFWKDPDQFDLERFREEEPAGRPRFAYFPFGGGPRQCIGNQFAILEALTVLAMVLGRFRLTPHGDGSGRIAGRITLRPSGGVPVRLSPRAGSDATR